MERLLKALFLWAFGGLLYYGLETLWRGYSYSSMFIVGGFCFIYIGIINEWFNWEMSLISQMFISAIGVTIIELISGLILNKCLNLGIWDYSHMPYNFMGQICLIFFVAWFGLSLPAILLDDVIRWKMLGEDKPHYKIL